MPRYLFHAPDGHVYGPVHYETLSRWKAEGRLRDHDRLRAEGTPQEGPFVTYAEIPVPAQPVPTPESETVTAPPREAGPVPVPALLARAASLTLRGFWTVLPASLLMQVPLQAMNFVFPTDLDAATGAPIWMHDPKAWALLAVALLFIMIGEAALTAYYGALHRTGSASLTEAFRTLRGRMGGFLWTQFLRVCILFSWMLLVGVFVTLALGAKGWLRPLAVLAAVLVCYPALLLLLRYLIVPQVVILEKWSGLFALRRAGDLVRFSGQDGLFSGGDLRLVAGLFPWFLGSVAISLVAALAEKLPHHGKLISQIVLYCGTSLIYPFLIAFFTLFVLDARKRLRAAGLE